MKLSFQNIFFTCGAGDSVPEIDFTCVAQEVLRIRRHRNTSNIFVYSQIIEHTWYSLLIRDKQYQNKLVRFVAVKMLKKTTRNNQYPTLFQALESRIHYLCLKEDEEAEEAPR